MDIFYEFASNEERDAALADAAYEMAAAKYKRDMMIIEANYEYNLKCAEYKCLTENGSFDDYTKMIMLATEDANEQKSEAKKSILEEIKKFFKRILDAIAYIFSGKIDNKQTVENAPNVDEINKKGMPIINKLETVWKSFIGKITGNNQPLADNEFEQLLQGIADIAGGIVVSFTTSMAVDALKKKVQPVTDKLNELKGKMLDWMIDQENEINAKKQDDPNSVTVKEKILDQGIKIFNAFRHPLDTIADAVSSVGNFFKGLIDKAKDKKAGKNGESTPKGTNNDEGAENPDATDTSDDAPGEDSSTNGGTAENGDASKDKGSENKGQSTTNPESSSAQGNNSTSSQKQPDKPAEKPAEPKKVDGKTKEEWIKVRDNAQKAIDSMSDADKKSKSGERKVKENEARIKSANDKIAQFDESTYSDFDVDELFAEFGL